MLAAAAGDFEHGAAVRQHRAQHIQDRVTVAKRRRRRLAVVGHDRQSAIPEPRSRAACYPCLGHRALRHHLDQVGAIGRAAVEVSSISPLADIVTLSMAAADQLAFSAASISLARITPFCDAPVAATRTSPALLQATNTPVSASAMPDGGT